MSEKSNRISRIYNRLRKGPVTIETLMKWAYSAGINVSERQLYRYMKEIEHSIYIEGEKVIVYNGEKNKKTWKIEFEDGEEKVSVFDVNTFYLVKNMVPLAIYDGRYEPLLNFENTVYRQFSQSPFEKNNFADDVCVKSTHFYEVSHSEKQHLALEDYIWSIQNQRKLVIEKVEFDNTSLKATEKFPVSMLPLLVLFHRGCIYLCGLRDEDKKLFVLGLEQIARYEITNELFDNDTYLKLMEEQLDQRFGVTENINDEAYDIELAFTKITGDFVRHYFWHKSQEFISTEDGGWLMKLHTGINRELVGWIFQWMSNVKVISPGILQHMVQKKIHDMARLYAGEVELVSNNDFRPSGA